MAKVKGTTIAGRLKWVRRHHGEQGLAKVLAELRDRDAAEKLQLGVLKSSWYPFELFIDVIQTIDRIHGKGDGALVRPLGGQVAADDLTGVYRVFFRFASPNYIIDKAMQVWRQYYDSGRFEIVENEPGRVKAILHDFETPHRLHCESVAGWIESCLQLTGAHDVRVTHEPCRARHGDRCEFRLLWE